MNIRTMKEPEDLDRNTVEREMPVSFMEQMRQQDVDDDKLIDQLKAENSMLLSKNVITAHEMAEVRARNSMRHVMLNESQFRRGKLQPPQAQQSSMPYIHNTIKSIRDIS